MTLQDAIALQPQWVQIWLYWLMIGAFILPLGLFLWKQTRWTAAFILLSDVFAAVGNCFWNILCFESPYD